MLLLKIFDAHLAPGPRLAPGPLLPRYPPHLHHPDPVGIGCRRRRVATSPLALSLSFLPSTFVATFSLAL